MQLPDVNVLSGPAQLDAPEAASQEAAKKGGYCAPCGPGSCPRDRALGFEDASLSPGVQGRTGLVGAMVSFEEGHELL